ncbi:Hypothetical protein, putative [Bodo saltans]|uniref:REH2 DRSM domain-containing protein n=1 Tax=Bodo saltans TaxID=75058 RepID=A0A0S4KIU0_BODSA|nr:Hypothetical protein, putative [Bodo saltans]|eukprot:CUI14884.1 Hypothetical protein, putative [Bodo saltans]
MRRYQCRRFMQEGGGLPWCDVRQALQYTHLGAVGAYVPGDEGRRSKEAVGASSLSNASTKRRGTAINTSTNSLLQQMRAFHCSFHEPITPELITIEVLVEDHHVQQAAGFSASTTEYDAGGAAQAVPAQYPAAPMSSASTSSSSFSSSPLASSSSSSSAYTDVAMIDAFAKGKVVNFLRRMGVKDTTIFHVSPEELTSTISGAKGRTVFRARAKLVLPHPHSGMYVAEGIGENEKDAESLAAMHAQFIIDALGVQLFRLSSPQVKHAEAARRAGRYAPLPDDPVKPAGTEVPGVCRMIALGSDRIHESTTSSAASGGTSSQPEPSSLLFRKYVMEAEIVGTPSGASASSSTSVGGASPDCKQISDTTQPSVENTPPLERGGLMDDSPLPPSAAVATSPRHPFSATCWAPWAAFGEAAAHDVPSSPAASSSLGGAGRTTAVPPSAVGGTFDPTENGSFQMVNVQSMRMSPSPDALLFPAVYDKRAYERLKDYFIGHGLDIKKQFHYSHVAVAGFSVRMFVAECRLAPGDVPTGVLASGKAQEKDCAMYLAAMHAELLLDACGSRLFPKDDVRQAKHAEAVRGFGRWAFDPTSTKVDGGSGGNNRRSNGTPFPLPLKQQVGGDEVWLEPGVIRRQRTFGDRVLVGHNELSQKINEMIEANPPQSLLTEARHLVKEWQRDVAHHDALPDAFLITKMGDFYRASTLLPVPREYGVRGGTAIARGIDQAIEMASLHALDTICSLGFPVCADPVRERAYLKLREQCGLVTKNMLAQWEHRHQEEGEGAAPASAASGSSHGNDVAAQTLASSSTTPPPQSLFRRRLGYLPGYIIEGSNVRMPPQFEDLWHAISLDTTKDFQCVTGVVAEQPFASIPSLPPQPGAPGGKSSSPAAVTATANASSSGPTLPPPPSDERIIEVGNDVRNNLQFYLNRVTQRPNAPIETSVFLTGYASNQSVYNIVFMSVPLLLATATTAQFSSPPVRSVATADPAASASACDQSVYNIVFMSVPLLAATATTTQVTSPPVRSVATADPAASASACAQHDDQSHIRGGGTVVDDNTNALYDDALKSFSLANEKRRDKAQLLAVGLSLKKKDAERMCFIHAAKLLLSHGVDIRKERDLLAMSRRGAATTGGTRSSSSSAPAATSPSAAAASPATSNALPPACSEPTTKTPLPPPVVHPAFTRQAEISAKEQYRTSQFQQQQRLRNTNPGGGGRRAASPF